jgi:hypothetical protein
MTGNTITIKYQLENNIWMAQNVNFVIYPMKLCHVIAWAPRNIWNLTDKISLSM